MSQARDYETFDDDEAELIDDPELNDELEAAIAEADASNPDDWIELGELIRRLRNDE
jgi:hypothetical protein